MKSTIVLTLRAKETFIATILQIKDKWGDGSADKFVERTYQVLDTIAQQPYLFKAYREENVRKAFITKILRLFTGLPLKGLKCFSFGITGRNQYSNLCLMH